MSYRKDLRRLAKRRGWTIEQTRSGHFKLSKPGCPSLRCAYSPRSESALRCVERDMERAEGERLTGWAG